MPESNRLDETNIPLGKELWLIHSSLAVYRVIGLNAGAIPRAGGFFGFVQNQSLSAVALGLRKVFEREKPDGDELCSAVEAQPAAKVPRIGYLSGNLASNPHTREAFRDGLRDLGYVEGRTLVIEYRDVEGKYEPWPPNKRPGPSPLSSLVLPIRLGAGSSPALRGRAAMSRDCPFSPRS